MSTCVSHWLLIGICWCYLIIPHVLCLLLDSSEQSFPSDHVKYYRSREDFFLDEQLCSSGKGTCEAGLHSKLPCWGYEPKCNEELWYSKPVCDQHHPSWSSSLAGQRRQFWEQGDFGYIKGMLSNMIEICSPRKEGDSSLRCVTNDRFCVARNLLIDLRKVSFKDSRDRYREDLFQDGDIGGYCKLNKKLHSQQNRNKSPLQSWYAELQSYTELPTNPLTDGKCDVVFEKPVFLFKLDAGVNLYHHFCDFVNLYASQHLNGSFNTDVHIIMWDTSGLGYADYFKETWKAFSVHPVTRLGDYIGKTVCFADAVFPLLARMIRGLFFNMPLVPYCRDSGLFRAFSHHLIHRLGVQQEEYNNDDIRVTLISRKTKYRNILNEDELLGAMLRVKHIRPKIVHYSPNFGELNLMKQKQPMLLRSMSFVDQVKISHNSDIIIGMHGAGLTHLLFLPDWGAVFEIYNTEDPDCYQDLARLRGVAYFTWENKSKLFQEDEGHHPTLGAHAKFTNYAFNVREFMRILTKAINHVLQKRPSK